MRILKNEIGASAIETAMVILPCLMLFFLFLFSTFVQNIQVRTISRAREATYRGLALARNRSYQPPQSLRELPYRLSGNIPSTIHEKINKGDFFNPGDRIHLAIADIAASIAERDDFLFEDSKNIDRIASSIVVQDIANGRIRVQWRSGHPLLNFLNKLGNKTDGGFTIQSTVETIKR